MILLGFSTGSMFSGNDFACSACFICLFSSSVAWFNWSIPNFPEESFIHPAATGCLTEAVQSAMIGIDVLLPVKVRPMGSKKHPQQRSEEHTSELQSHSDLVCRLLLEKKKKKKKRAQQRQAQKSEPRNASSNELD